MTKEVRKRTVPPTTPGEMLLEGFLKPLGVTPVEFARHVDMSPKAIDRIISRGWPVDYVVARKFGAALGTSAQFWLNAQNTYDLWRADQDEEALPEPLVVKVAIHDDELLVTLPK